MALATSHARRCRMRPYVDIYESCVMGVIPRSAYLGGFDVLVFETAPTLLSTTIGS